MAIWNAIRNIKFGNRDDDKLIVAELNKLGFFVCRLSAAKEESCKACRGTGKLVLHGKHGAVAHEYDCSLCAAKEEN